MPRREPTLTLSFSRFLATISELFGVDPLGRNADAIAALNPDKIYIENVRSVLGVSHAGAVRVCETAVRQGVFRRQVEVLCPDDSVAAVADSEAQLPTQVKCWKLGDEGHFEEVEMPTAFLRKTTFYALNGEGPSFVH